MKCTVAAAVLATALAGSAYAQSAEFKCPANGSQFAYKGAAFDKVSTMTGQDGNVCLYCSASDGKAEVLRVHWG